MKSNYLFPHTYKNLGWMVLVPSAIAGFLIVAFNYEPKFLELTVPAFFVNQFFGDEMWFGFIKNNILNEVIGVLLIVSALLVAFSKEKEEDEFIAKIRMESLVWATYVNYGILLLAMVFVYDLSFFWVMIINMFTILFIFIIRFNWLISKFRSA
ncbi:MAG: hypothetical protein IPN29_03360 [Saprospiraceae bacterium]|nr:hypothetical protein [Saprospiraceae bacterium]